MRIFYEKKDIIIETEKFVVGNLVEEDLAAGESNIEENVTIGYETILPLIRHRCDAESEMLGNLFPL